MKTLIVTLVIFSTLIACNEENPQPVDLFVGSWQLTSTDIPVEISFDVVREGSVYNYYNKVINHPAIPLEEQTNNTMITYDKFDGGFGRIEITSRGSVYYKVTMIYNRFTEDGMSVYDVQLDIPSEPFIVLQDQIFVRK